ncbi:unnamed protein product [Closterium sp. NIES-65]|nr:unnamed protein product [Closterium sp. NIES-65]
MTVAIGRQAIAISSLRNPQFHCSAAVIPFFPHHPPKPSPSRAFPPSPLGQSNSHPKPDTSSHGCDFISSLPSSVLSSLPSSFPRSASPLPTQARHAPPCIVDLSSPCLVPHLSSHLSSFNPSPCSAPSPTRLHLLPPRRAELAHADVATADVARVQLEGVFSAFEEEPVWSSSIAQCHAASSHCCHPGHRSWLLGGEKR